MQVNIYIYTYIYIYICKCTFIYDDDALIRIIHIYVYVTVIHIYVYVTLHHEIMDRTRLITKLGMSTYPPFPRMEMQNYLK